MREYDKTQAKEINNHLYYKVISIDHLQDSILLALINPSSQTAVSDGIDDDWLVGLGARLLEEFRTFDRQNITK